MTRTAPMADLARHSADVHYRRIPRYVQSHYLVRKLDEFATYLSRKLGKAAVPAGGKFGVDDLLKLLEPPYAGERESYLQDAPGRASSRTPVEPSSDESDPEIRRVTEMGLSDLEMFVEVLMAMRGTYHRRYITEFLDSVFKRRDAGLMHQPKRGARRFVLSSHLLEVLLQIAVLESSGSGFATRELLVDELLTFLCERYGIYVDRLPPGDGFGTPSINDLAALRRRTGKDFENRLREIGFFRDLSDAFVTQTISPRYTISASDGRPT